jgi:peptidoglycan/xylan/chitin deacetylase (PgdA/CDA1 family)
VDTGLPLLDAHGVKATFYVSLKNAEKRVDSWKRAVAHGHEIGNHSLSHACTGNYHLSSGVALEDFDLAGMRRDLDQANAGIKRMLGVVPSTFAYPCGQKFVRAEARTHSAGGEGSWRTRLPIGPERSKICDLAQAMGIGATI